MRKESKEYRMVVTYKTATQLPHAAKAFAFLPRTFFGGAGFFSFFETRSAETRARAACINVISTSGTGKKAKRY